LKQLFRNPPGLVNKRSHSSQGLAGRLRKFVDALLAALQEEMGETAVVPSSPDALSEQETHVLRLLVAGLSKREIGNELFISPGTAKWHVPSILQILGASNRAQAAVRAREMGLFADSTTATLPPTLPFGRRPSSYLAV
jgi:DNA-binding NarL/FixJ family response regulator